MAAALTRSDIINGMVSLAPVTDANREQVKELNAQSEHMHNPSVALSALDDKADAQTRAIYLCSVTPDNTKNTLIGFALWDYHNGAAKLYVFMIDKQYQGLGAGKKSLECVLDEIARCAPGNGNNDTAECKIFLTVSENNNVAKKLYENIGFERVDANGATIMYCISWKK